MIVLHYRLLLLLLLLLLLYYHLSVLGVGYRIIPIIIYLSTLGLNNHG